MKSLEIVFLKSARADSRQRSPSGRSQAPCPPPKGLAGDTAVTSARLTGLGREGGGRNTEGRGWERLKVGKKVWVERILRASTRGCAGTPGRGRWEKLWLICSEVFPAMSHIYLAFPCTNPCKKKKKKKRRILPGMHERARNKPRRLGGARLDELCGDLGIKRPSSHSATVP